MVSLHRNWEALWPFFPIKQGEQLFIRGNEFHEFTISNSLGQLIKFGKLEKGKTQIINLDHIESGIYLMNLRGDPTSTTRKLVVQ